MNLLVIGIDPGATIGLAAVTGAGDYLASSSADDLDVALEFVRRWSQTIGADKVLLAIESVKQVYPRERFTSKMATALLLAERQVGEIVATARHIGLDVLEVTAAQWRRAVVGGKSPSDARIKAVVSRVVKGMPTRSNAHERDALGCAVFGARWWKVQTLKKGGV